MANIYSFTSYLSIFNYWRCPPSHSMKHMSSYSKQKQSIMSMLDFLIIIIHLFIVMLAIQGIRESLFPLQCRGGIRCSDEPTRRVDVNCTYILQHINYRTFTFPAMTSRSVLTCVHWSHCSSLWRGGPEATRCPDQTRLTSSSQTPPSRHHPYGDDDDAWFVNNNSG